MQMLEIVSFIVQLTLVSSLFYFEHKSKVCFSPWRESKLVQDLDPNTFSYAKQEAYESFARKIAACARLKLWIFFSKVSIYKRLLLSLLLVFKLGNIDLFASVFTHAMLEIVSLIVQLTLVSSLF